MAQVRILERLENQFGSFIVEELTYDSRYSRVLFSGYSHSAQSGLALDDDPKLLFDYIQQLFELALELQPKNILILGGGTLTLATALCKHLPETEITVVEINQDLIALAEKYFGYKEDPRLKIVIDDAEHFVTHQKDHCYELIITDLFNDLAIPDQFMSKAFAKRLRRILKADGLVATNCIAALSGPGSQPGLKLAAAYLGAIGQVRVLRVDNYRYYLSWTPQNLLILAGSHVEDLLSGLNAVQIDL